METVEIIAKRNIRYYHVYGFDMVYIQSLMDNTAGNFLIAGFLLGVIFFDLWEISTRGFTVPNMFILLSALAFMIINMGLFLDDRKKLKQLLNEIKGREL